MRDLTHNDISTSVLDCCFKIHRTLGPGLFESVYESILCQELTNAGLHFVRQQTIPVVWKGIKLNQGFIADLIVESKVLIEIKSIAALAPVHNMQVLTYLKLTNLSLGLLINFNNALLKDGIKRVINGSI